MTSVMKVFALAILAFVIPVFGQGFEPKARVVIPFDFAAGDTILPDGRVNECDRGFCNNNCCYSRS